MGQDLRRTGLDVLLVEGDDLVRLCLAEGLGDAGHQVTAASDAGRALGAVDDDTGEGRGKAPDVLVTDLRRGYRVDGPALIAAAR